MSEVTNTNELIDDAKCIDACIPAGLQLPALIVLFAQMAGLVEADTPIPDSPLPASSPVLTLDRITTDTAFFSWVYSGTNPPNGFAIFYGTVDGGGMTPLVYAAGTERTAVVEGLSSGTNYYFVVAIMGGSGTPITGSNQVQGITRLTESFAAMIPVVVATTQTTVTVAWGTDLGPPSGGRWLITYGVNPGSPDGTVQIDDPNAYFAVITGLSPNTTYYFTVAGKTQYAQSGEAIGATLAASTPGHSIWAVDMTAAYTITPFAGVVADSAGRAITAGGYNRADAQYNPDFGDGPITGTTGIRNGYVASHNADHTVRWVRFLQSQGPSECAVYGLTVDNQDRITVCGFFSGTVDFGGESMTAVGFNDGFVVKYLPGSQGTAGAIVWKRQFTSGGNVYAMAVAVDSSRDVFVAARMNAQTNVGTVASPVLFDPDFCVVKLNGSTGATIAGSSRAFANANYPTASDFPKALAVDGADNVIMTGKAGGSVSFGGGSGTGIFVVKFSGTGLTHIWSAFPGAGQGNAIAVRASNNNIYVGGNDSLGFFVAAYAANGTLLWNYQNGPPDGGNHTDSVIAISVTNSKITITGRSDAALNLGHGWTFGTGYLLVQFTPAGDTIPAVDDFVKRATSNGQSWGYGVVHSGSVLYNVGPFQSFAINFGDGVTATPRAFQDAFLLQCNS